MTLTSNRRQFLTASATSCFLAAACHHQPQKKLQFKYLLASSMYGKLPLAVIVPQIALAGASALDVWPEVHGNQREQIDEMGVESFQALLERHHTRLGCLTQFPLGPFGLTEEIKFASQLACRTIVTGSRGPRGLKGQELKSAVARFVEQMKPHLETAASAGVTIAIENHSNSLIHSPDSIRWLVELRTSDKLAIALAPYHLPQDTAAISNLIRQIPGGIAVFYAWQYGEGCMTQLPKERELLQLPGRGELDFQPILQALADVDYQGWTEIFMHPFPRGIPIHPTADAVTAEINRSRDYLNHLLKD